MLGSLFESETMDFNIATSFDLGLKIKEMKTETLTTDKFIVKIDDRNIQLHEKEIQLIIQEHGLTTGEIQFQGYNLGEFNVATLKYFHCSNETEAKQLIKRATMIAWELGYDLFLSNKNEEIFKECGFKLFQNYNREIYCAELTWNAFERINESSITSFINRQN